MALMGIGLTAVLAIVNIVIGGLLLWVAARVMKVNKGWGIPYLIALIVGVVGFVLGLIPFAGGVLAFIVNIALGLWLIKTKYKLAWGKAVVVWLIWFIASLIVGAIIGLIVAAVFIGGALAAGGIGALS